MRVAITGASGLVGSQLLKSLLRNGDEVVRLVRRASGAPDEAEWDPGSGDFDVERVGNAEAFVHLAGESIAGGRWSEARKEAIRTSRVAATERLAIRISELPNPPKTLLVASATGFYGDRQDDLLDEGSAPGEGFLAEVCKAWEAAAFPARQRGVRVVNLRFGVVLSPEGGALQTMLVPFRLGAGGRVGSGLQWMSWVSIDDAIGILKLALTSEELSGPVNVVAPNPVRNADFTAALGRALGRPTLLPVPAPMLRALLGEMADEALLASCRAVSRRLPELGYRFQHARIGSALRHLLG